jgi:hypothetical protein
MPGYLSVDTTIAMFYTVEYRARDTGYWTEEKTFKPDYQITKTIKFHKFLFFTWETTLTECPNEEAAEDAARTLAIKCARSLSDKEVRIRSCTHFTDYDEWFTIWLNGKFKDC